ncbi:MAG: CPBP family intramembrane metalloprotease [Clostridia bacterium]|nr:CPBP family intramembrane metalloprotease [Clostridia bacterium]
MNNYHHYYGNTGYNPNVSAYAEYGGVPNLNNFDFEEYNRKLEIQKEKDAVKKMSNRIGLALVLFQIIIPVLSVVLIIPLIFNGGIDLSKYSYNDPFGSSLSIIDPVTLYLLNGVLCLIGFLFVGIMITRTNHVRLDETIFIKRTNIADTVKIVVSGMGVVFVFNVLLALMNFHLSLFGFENNMPDYGEVKGLTGGLLYFVAVAVVPPIIEEFVFRGAILGTVRKFYGDTLAITVSAVLFGFAHANFIQTPVTFLTGLVLGWITIKTGSIVPAMLLHFLNNSIAVITQLIQYNTGNETLFNIFDISVSGIFLIIGLLCAISLIRKHGNKLFVFERKESKLTFSQQLKAVFTAPWMIVFTIITLLTCLTAASM